MRTAAKITKTFSLDRAVLAEVKRTKGNLSESARVNSLLQFALDLEKRAALDRESAGFFRSAPADRQERRGFQSKTLAAWARND
jgi:hypothetical protein